MTRFSPKNFFQELRRRRVFSVVALYAATAWVVIEVGDEVIEAGLITALTTRELIILAIIGFPLTLIAGWFYDITKHGIVRTAPDGVDDSFDGALRARDYGLLVLLVAAWLAVYMAVPAPRPVEQSFVEKPAVARPVNAKSIAILPFESRSDDPENVNLAFGLHDDLMTHLGRVSDLTLIAKSSVSQVEPGASDGAVSAMLGAAYIMRGSVERVLDQIRVNVTLVEAAEARQAWSNQFDSEFSMENLFNIRKEIATSITDELESVLTPEETSRLHGAMPTDNLEAYQLYMRGRQLSAKRGREDLEQSLVLYRQALELDPEFALAWVGIADATYILSNGDYIDFDEALADRREAVDRALALDDQLGEAYTSLAMVHYDEYLDEDVPEKMAEACRKSMELSPNYAQGHHWCMEVWRGQADGPEDRLTAYYRIAQMDPMSAVTQLNIALTLKNMGRTDEAREQFEHVLQLDPGFFHGYRWYGLFETELGNFAHGVALIRRADELNPGYMVNYFNLITAYRAMWEFDHVARVVEAFLALDNPNVQAGYENWDLLLNMQLSLARGDWREMIRLFETAGAQKHGWSAISGLYAWAFIIAGDFERAREPWFNGSSDHVDPNETEDVIRHETGCVTAGLLMATGDEERGRELLARTTHYFEETLKQIDPNRARTWVCYLVEGRHQDALDEYEKWVERGYISMWWRDRQLPWWEPVRDTPRFRALEERIAGMIAEQQELLRQMDESSSSEGS